MESPAELSITLIKLNLVNLTELLPDSPNKVTTTTKQI